MKNTFALLFCLLPALTYQMLHTGRLYHSNLHYKLCLIPLSPNINVSKLPSEASQQTLMMQLF